MKLTVEYEIKYGTGRWFTHTRQFVRVQSKKRALETTAKEIKENFTGINSEFKCRNLRIVPKTRVAPTDLKPISIYGDKLPLEQWLIAAHTGAFVDYDGHGYWATFHGMKGIVKPSDVTQLGVKPPAWATHVVWFSK